MKENSNLLTPISCTFQTIVLSLYQQKGNKPLKLKVMNIELMTRAELECEILMDDSLYNFLGGDSNLENISKMTDDELKLKITEWIIEGDETQRIIYINQ